MLPMLIEACPKLVIATDEAVLKVATSVVVFGKAPAVDQFDAGLVSFQVAPSPPPVHVALVATALSDNPNDNDRRIRRYLEDFIGFGGGRLTVKRALVKRGFIGLHREWTA